MSHSVEDDFSSLCYQDGETGDQRRKGTCSDLFCEGEALYQASVVVLCLSLTLFLQLGSSLVLSGRCPLFFFFFFLRFYLFTHERHTERGRDTGRGRSRLHAGRLTWDSILGLQDQALG